MAQRVARWGSWLLQNRRTVRAPIPLFRAGLGFLFTRRMLLLEHVGRRSGQPRYAVLEVVREESPTSVVVASGFGPGAQWFRNLLAEPHCHVSIGFTRRCPAMAHVLGEDEAGSVLRAYQQERPGAWEKLSAVIVEATGEADPKVPLVRLDLRPRSAPEAGSGPAAV